MELELTKEALIKAIINHDIVLAKDIPPEFQTDRDVIRILLDNIGCQISEVNELFCDDFVIMRALVKKNCGFYKYASDKLKKDVHLALTAIKQSHKVFEYVPDELKENYQFMKAAIDINGKAIKYMQGYITKDDVIKAVSTPGAFKHIPEEFIYDKDVIYIALEIATKAYAEYVPTSNLITLSYSSDDDTDDRIAPYIYNIQIIMYYLSKNKQLLGDKEFMKRILKINGNFLNIVSDLLCDDKELVLTAVNQFGLALKYASTTLKDDKEVVLTAVKQCGLAIQYATPRLQFDIDCICNTLATYPKIYFVLNLELQANHEVMMSLLTNNGSYIAAVDSRLLTDELKIAAITNCPKMIKYTGLKFVNFVENKEIISEAVRQNPSILRHLPKKWRIEIYMTITSDV
jgi:hypothetical protein